MNLVRIGSYDSYESLAMANTLASQLLKQGLDTRIISWQEGEGTTALLRGLEADEFDLIVLKTSQHSSMTGALIKLGTLEFEYKQEVVDIQIFCSEKLRESSKKEIKEIIDQSSSA